MLRLTPPNYQIIEDAVDYLATYGGTEANVAISLAGFGHHTVFVSKLPNNQLGEAATKYLKANNVDTSYIHMEGSNIGIYFLETGFGIRPSKVLYNRRHSSITTISLNEIDIEKILVGVNWFHFSGITLALHENVRTVLFEILKKAKEKNIFISFDSNYRESLWSIDEAKASYLKVAPYIDLFFASAFDCKHLFDIKLDNENEVKYLEKLQEKYQAKYIFGYQRKVHSATDNELKAYCVTSKGIVYTNSYRFNIFDRIGAGDAFAAGIIHGLLKTNDIDFALEFGLKTSILKHTLWGDAFKLGEKDVLNYMLDQSKEVKR